MRLWCWLYYYYYYQIMLLKKIVTKAASSSQTSTVQKLAVRWAAKKINNQEDYTNKS